MPELQPFRGLHYRDVGELADLVCPPYDLISPLEQRRLHERHRYNAVRLELPFARPGEDNAARYLRAGAEFRRWLQYGVLVAEQRERVYAYRQDYDTGGRRGRVAGVIGALSLAGYKQPQGVLPHENTMPAPIRDRLALLHAYPYNVSCIQVLYRGDGSSADVHRQLESRTPDVTLHDDGGTLHRMWRIEDHAEAEALTAPVGSGPVVIADGHHRFETALAYHSEKAGAAGNHGSVMCFCVDGDLERPVVRPWHRVFRSSLPASHIADRLAARWPTTELEPDEPSEDSLAGTPTHHRFVWVMPGRRLLMEVPRSDVDAVASGRPEPWRMLDVVALHEVVLRAVFEPRPEELRFTAEPAEVVRLVEQDGWTAGVLVHAPGVQDIIEIALCGERVPPKSSYFWPKPLTGLVFRSLE